MTRWSITLSAYKIKIKHIAGNKNTTVDALSQKFIEDKNKNKLKQAILNEFINKSTFPVEELSNEPILEEKQNILRQHHDLPTARHSSIKEMLCPRGWRHIHKHLLSQALGSKFQTLPSARKCEWTPDVRIHKPRKWRHIHKYPYPGIKVNGFVRYLKM